MGGTGADSVPATREEQQRQRQMVLYSTSATDSPSHGDVKQVPEEAVVEAFPGAELQARALEHEDRGEYKEAEDLYKEALALVDEGSKHLVEVGVCLQNLSRLYRHQGRMDEAMEFCEQAVVSLETALGPQTMSVYQVTHDRHRIQAQMASALSTLAGLHKRLKQMDKAEELLRRALQVSEAALGPEHCQMATCYNNLGMLLSMQNKLGAAEPIMRQALKIMRDAMGRNHEKCGPLIDNVASILDKQAATLEGMSEEDPQGKRARFANAKKTEANYLRDLRLLQQETTRAESSLLDAEAAMIQDAAETYQQCGCLDDAERLLQESVKLVEKLHGKDSYRVAAMLNNLAAMYQLYSAPGAASNHPKVLLAEPMLRRALSITTEAYGANHPEVAQRAENLATFYLSQARHADAFPLLEAAIEISAATVERGTVDEESDIRQLAKWGSRLDKLGKIHLDQGTPELAEPLLRLGLEKLREAHGGPHADVAYCLYNLAQFHRMTGDDETAQELTNQAIEIQQ